MRHLELLGGCVVLAACCGKSTIGGGDPSAGRAGNGVGVGGGMVRGTGGTTGGTGTNRGGTGGMGTGGTGTSGTGGTGVSGGAAGRNAGGGSAGWRQAPPNSAGSPTLDPDDVGCDYVQTVNQGCAKSGCHKGAVPSSGLNLVLDSGFVARLKDVPAQFGDIDCDPSTEYAECTTPPSDCVPGAKLVDSASWEASWLIRKLRGTQGNCGEPAFIDEPTSEHRDEAACIELLVQAIAALP